MQGSAAIAGSMALAFRRGVGQHPVLPKGDTMRRNRTVPRGQVHRLTHDQQGARRQPARRSDRARAACLHAARLQGRHAPAAAGRCRRLHRLGHGPHQLEGLHRERAGAAGPADRRRQDGPGGRCLPGLLFAPRRQPVHQLGRDGPLRGLPDPGDRALGRGPLLRRRPRQSRRSSASPPAASAPSPMACGTAISGRRWPAIPATWRSSSAICTTCRRR